MIVCLVVYEVCSELQYKDFMHTCAVGEIFQSDSTNLTFKNYLLYIVTYIYIYIYNPIEIYTEVFQVSIKNIKINQRSL